MSRLIKHPLCFFAITAFLLTWANLAMAQAPDHWRVIWHEKPSTEAFVSWTTQGAGTTHKVYLDTVSRQGVLNTYAQQLDATVHGKYVDDNEAHYHHIKLDGLQPSTVYYFVIESDGQATQEFHFKTAPNDMSTFKMLYGGDSRSDREDRKKMNQRIATLIENDDQILGLIHGGDYINDGYKWEEWSAWLDDHELHVTSSGRILPIIPARGNHERDGKIYNLVFAGPGGDSRFTNYFVTQLSPMAALINLDTSGTASGEQRDWLEQRLLEMQTTRWLTVNYHIPAYPAVKLPGPAKLYWVPLFENYNVDMVFESDGHVLKRTVPIRNEKYDETGVVYVGEGGLGVKQREPDTKRWYLQAPGMAMSGHHVQVITYAPDGLTYEAVLMDGTVADSYTRKPRQERMLGDFEVTEVKRGGMTGVDIFVSFAVDENTIDQNSFTIEPEAKLDRIILSQEKQKLRLIYEALTPGQTYTITLSDVRDYSGRPIKSRAVTYMHPGMLPADMGGGDMGSDMGNGDMSPDMNMGDMGADMSTTPPKPTPKDQDDGCSALNAQKTAPIGLIVFFGLIWGVMRRRKRLED